MVSPRQRRFGDQRGPKYGRLWTRVPAPRGLSRGAPGAHRGGLLSPTRRTLRLGETRWPRQRPHCRERGEGGADSGRARRMRLPRVKPCLLQEAPARTLGTFPCSPTARSGPWARGTRGVERTRVCTRGHNWDTCRPGPGRTPRGHAHTRARPDSGTHTRVYGHTHTQTDRQTQTHTHTQGHVPTQGHTHAHTQIHTDRHTRSVAAPRVKGVGPGC